MFGRFNASRRIAARSEPSARIFMSVIGAAENIIARLFCRSLASIG
jgi:hypothetical protein